MHIKILNLLALYSQNPRESFNVASKRAKKREITWRERRRDCNRRAGRRRGSSIKDNIEHMSRLDIAHWNCRVGFTRFSGRSARKTQLYADICRWNCDGEHLVAPGHRRARVCERCALAWARRTPAAYKPPEAAPCLHPRNICKYIYVYFKYIGPVHTYACVYSVSIHTILYMHIEYTANPANTYMSVVYAIVARARTLTAFPRAYMCTRDLLSQIETNYATWTISRDTT